MIIDKNSNFAPHPETDGPIRAVVVDITEPKEVQTAYGPKKKFAIVFQTELEKEPGQRWTHWDHGYTPSIDEKATLRKNATKILGGTELPVPFDTEMLIGKPVNLIIEHKHVEGKTYANITYYGAYKGNDPLKPDGKYVRQKDKDKNDAGSSYQKAESTPESKDDWQKTKVHVGNFKGQEVENLPVEAIEGLINRWMPTTQAEGYRITADDKRLITALNMAKAAMAAANAPADAGF
jgi:hypothetical protein